MACSNPDLPITIWHLTGDNSGYGDKFENAISGLGTWQDMNMLTQSNDGKDYDFKTEAYINIEPRNGSYIAFGEYTGTMPDDSALQIKQIIKSTLQENTWMVRLG